MDKHIQEQGPVTNSKIAPVFAIEERKRTLPSIITRMVLGATTIYPWHKQTDLAVVSDIYGETILSFIDFNIAKEISERIIRELSLERVVSSYQVLIVRDRAQAILESMTDERAGKKGIVMLRDTGGCGYWRMMLTARYMDRKNIYIDLTGGAVKFDSLLEYDTIYVQRIHDWESFYILERLKKIGKRIIYDIDDDLFAIPEDNPASRMMGRNEQMAAVECMKLADVVTTTTTVLQERLAQLLDGRTPVVVPNALDLDEGWLPTQMTGSPDGWQRIFWQGSNTHDEDWHECFDALDHIMAKRKNIRLVLMGFLPTRIRENMNAPHWKDRIEYLGPMEPEAYFHIIKHIRAEVGLAPLNQNVFNMAKSPIKWIENSMIGMPTVASDVWAYSDVIENVKDGFLCSSKEDWIEAIEICLDDAKARKAMVEKARQKIRSQFDIKDIVKTWKQVLCGV